MIDLIVPVAALLATAGLGLAATLWGEDSALASASRRDGRAIRSALKPE